MRADLDAYDLVYHEYAHTIMMLNFQRLPPWLNEGLADFYGATRIGNEAFTLGVPPRHHLAWLNQQSLRPLEALFRVRYDSPEYNEEDKTTMFYAQSWAVVHYLILGTPDGGAKIARLLELLAGDLEESAAAERALGDLKSLQDGLQSYVRRPAFPIVKGKVSVANVASELPVRALSAAEIDALHGALYVHTGQSEEAAARLRRAVELDPRLPDPHEWLGMAAWWEKHFDEARQHLERALERDPTRAEALTLLGWVLQAADGGEAETAGRAQKCFERALEIDAGLPHALAGLAALSAARGIDVQGALSLARRAVHLDPGDVNHRLTVARILIQTGQRDEARTELERALVRARAQPQQKVVRDLLDNLDAPPATSAETRGPSD